MRKLLLLFLLGIFYIPTFAQTTYIGSLEITDGTFNRPDPGTPPTSLSVYTSTIYDVITINITTPGFYTVTSLSPFDNFGVLYGTGGFDPLDPLNNALVANDDQSGTSFGFTYNFTTVGTYYLVVTSFKNGITGSYTVNLNPVGTVPVKLVSFTAEKNGTFGNTIKWSTIEETNISTFQLQYSVDGKTFSNLPGAVITPKNYTGSNFYSYAHNNPAAGKNYYRLQVAERGGRTILSNIAKVTNSNTGAADMKVYPNPVANYLTLETNTSSSGKAMVSVVNASGTVVYTKQYNLLASQQNIQLDVRKFAAGKYFIKTTIGSVETVSTFIKD